MDAILRAARIGAFAGLAITAGALSTGSDWLIEPLWKSESDEKDLKELDLNELKQRYEKSLQKHLKEK